MFICGLRLCIFLPPVVEHAEVGPIVSIGRVEARGVKEVPLGLLVAVQLAQCVGQVEVQGRLVGQVTAVMPTR